MMTHPSEIKDYKLPGLLRNGYSLSANPATYAITLHGKKSVIRVHFDHLGFLVVKALLEAYPGPLGRYDYRFILLGHLHDAQVACDACVPLMRCCSEILQDAFGLIITYSNGWYRLAQYEEVHDDRL